MSCASSLEEPMDDVQVADERKRVREFFKYFQSASDATRYISNNVESAEAYDPSIARLSSDPVLNALAQLGTLRLNCERSFISLIDSENQHIVAETSRSISLYDTSRHDEGDELCMGERPLDLHQGVCAATLRVFTNPDGRYNIFTDNITADSTRYIINDFSVEELYKNRPYVTGFPFMRFYAEVPLRTPSGYVLGSYCVVDSAPRAGMNEEGILILKEIADAIMSHLELIRTREEHARAERLLQGLNSFVQAKSIGDRSSVNKTLSRAEDSPGAGMSAATIDAENSPLRFGAAARPNAVAQRSSLTNPSAETDTSTVSILGKRSSFTELSTSSPSSSMEREKVESILGQTRTNQYNGSDSLTRLENENPSSPPSDIVDEEKAEGVSVSGNRRAEIESNFSRAAEILREAMDLEGVTFLNTTPETQDRHSRSSSNRGSTSEILTTWLRPRSSKTHQAMCRKLGHSSQQKPGLTVDSISADRFTLPTEGLEWLLKRYPRGQIFNFEGNLLVPLSPEDSSLTERSEPLPGMATDLLTPLRKEEESLLGTYFSGARSVVFVPLWDPHKGTWFAGGFGWTVDPKRVLGPDSFAYFSACGNSIMAEITRLELVATDRAKADFLSTISHELRSPLHGILGSAELLRENLLGPSQQELVEIIQNCGVTLLDTMDHLLDFAKINNIARNKMANRRKASISGQRALTEHNFDAQSPFDPTLLIEDLVDSILAGHRFQRAWDPQKYPGVTKQSHSYGALIQSMDAAQPEQLHLTVFLDISKRSKQLIRSEAGAWRRIIVNLLGNALKYTSSGFVRIALQSTDITESLESESFRSMLKLTITDSGRGISKDYLQHKLFTPFAQEDTFSIGTGLGLSIVKQIVTSLRGSIDVQSEIGIGTEIAVTVPVKLESATAPSVIESSLIPRLSNETMCLFAFDSYPDLDSTPTGVLSASSQLSLNLKAAMAEQAEQWFGLHVVSAQTVQTITGNLIIVSETNLHLLVLDDSRGVETAKLPQGASLIVLSTDPAYAAKTRRNPSQNVHYVTHPFGPRKMARVLSRCLTMDNDHHDWNLGTISALEQSKSDLDATLNGALSRTLDLAQQEATIPGQGSSQKSEASQKDLQQPIPTGVLEIKEKPFVLLVDDNEINLKILVTYMKKLDCDYIVAVNGLEALKCYKESNRRVDYVLMDLSMPVMNGYTSAREIRAFEKQMEIYPTIMVALTGLGSAEAHEEAYSCGMNLFLTKPVPMREIKALMEARSAQVETRILDERSSRDRTVVLIRKMEQLMEGAEEDSEEIFAEHWGSIRFRFEDVPLNFGPAELQNDLYCYDLVDKRLDRGLLAADVYIYI